MEKICPCLQSILSKFIQLPKDKSYPTSQEFEEEEFINHRENLSLDDHIQPPKNIAQQTLTSITPVSASVNQKISKEDIQISKAQSKTEQKSQEPFIQRQEAQAIDEKELLISHQQPSRQENNTNVLDSVDEIVDNVFKINLDMTDPMYNKLNQKARNAQELFKKRGIRLEIDQPNINELSVQKIEEQSTAYLIQYKLSCDYAFYNSILKNEHLLQTFSNTIVQTKTIQLKKPNLTVNNIKINLQDNQQTLSFLYLKYHNNLIHNHCEIYTDYNQPQLEPNNNSLLIVKQIKQEGGQIPFILINQYIEITFNQKKIANIQSQLINQYKNFLSNMETYINNNLQRLQV